MIGSASPSLPGFRREASSTPTTEFGFQDSKNRHIPLPLAIDPSIPLPLNSRHVSPIASNCGSLSLRSQLSILTLYIVVEIPKTVTLSQAHYFIQSISTPPILKPNMTDILNIVPIRYPLKNVRGIYDPYIWSGRIPTDQIHFAIQDDN